MACNTARKWTFPVAPDLLARMHHFAGDGHAERKFAAALGVLGTVNLPIIHYAVEKWGGLHPSNVARGGLKHPDMVTALLVGFGALLLLTPLLLWLRTALALSEARLDRAEQRALERETG